MLMEVSEVFRANLLSAMKDADIKAAELSRRAGLNPRMVKDIEEGRSQSPKLSTVFALCKALGRDPGEMLGLGSRATINQELAEFLRRFDEDDQARLLAALQNLPGLRP